MGWRNESAFRSGADIRVLLALGSVNETDADSRLKRDLDSELANNGGPCAPGPAGRTADLNTK